MSLLDKKKKVNTNNCKTQIFHMIRFNMLQFVLTVNFKLDSNSK